jgi:hypothetical protein
MAGSVNLRFITADIGDEGGALAEGEMVGEGEDHSGSRICSFSGGKSERYSSSDDRVSECDSSDRDARGKKRRGGMKQ